MSTNLMIQKITRMKEDLSKLEKEDNRLQGEQDALMRQLEKDHGCKTLEEADKKLLKLDAEKEKLEQDLADGYAELKEKHGW